MIWNEHSHLEGEHAFLSASKWHWLNDDDLKLTDRYFKHKAAQRGSDLHDFAQWAINLKIRLDKRTNKTLAMYVNDAIGYQMRTEQKLYYSDICYGTADAISFVRNYLRIHDYKSGVTEASMNQLLIYAALFCLEYGHNPEDIQIELRIYQSEEILIHRPEPDEVLYIMDEIISKDKHIEQLETGGLMYNE